MHLIKGITGIRRCGKSLLLESFQEELLAKGVEKEQILAVNFEDMDFAPLCTADALHAYVVQRLLSGRMNYIFLDEVQNVADFQKAVDSLFLRKNVDLYIAGSNAVLLSGELATLLSGRYVEIHVLPLSFSEYLDFTDTDASNTGADASYRSSDLGGVFNTVILKDVVARKKIADAMMLEDVIRFMFDNIGNLFSTKKISDTMTSAGRKIATHTVESYLSALTDSFILYRCSRFDVKGRQYLKTGGKYYLADIGLRWYLLGNKGIDQGFVLERELLPLRLSRDHHPKYLLSLDDDPPASYEGIRRINLIDWLLERRSYSICRCLLLFMFHGKFEKILTIDVNNAKC